MPCCDHSKENALRRKRQRRVRSIRILRKRPSNLRKRKSRR